MVEPSGTAISLNDSPSLSISFTSMVLVLVPIIKMETPKEQPDDHMSIPRTMMLHSAIHWPDITDASLSPMAVAHAVYVPMSATSSAQKQDHPRP
jgi:hypothetical protein